MRGVSTVAREGASHARNARRGVVIDAGWRVHGMYVSYEGKKQGLASLP